MRELGLKRFVTPVVDIDRLVTAPRGYRRFFADFRRYRRLAPGEDVTFAEAYPQIHDRTETSAIDPHYFHQDVWAARRVAELGPPRHVDVGSRVDYVGFLTAFTQSRSSTSVRSRLTSRAYLGGRQHRGHALRGPLAALALLSARRRAHRPRPLRRSA